MLHRTRHLFIRQQTAVINAYVKRQKNDATDAEAICEAVTRANMRFVPTKTPEQQSCLMWFKILSQYDIADAGGLAILVGLSIVASNVPSRSLATA